MNVYTWYVRTTYKDESGISLSSGFSRRLIRAAVGGRRDVRARRRRRWRWRPRPHRRAVFSRALQVVVRRLLHVPAVPARLPAGPGTRATIPHTTRRIDDTHLAIETPTYYKSERDSIPLTRPYLMNISYFIAIIILWLNYRTRSALFLTIKYC